MQKITWVVEKLINLCNLIGGIALVLMMTIVTFNIFYRLIGHTIVGIIEMTQVTMVLVIWMAMAHCSLRDGHVRVDIVKRWPLMDRGMNLVVFAGCIVFGVQCLRQSAKILDLGKQTAVLGIPQAPFYYITAFGFFLVALAVVLNEYKHYADKRSVKKNAMNESSIQQTVAE